MGVALAPIFKKEFPGADSFERATDGKNMSRNMYRLDEICADKGVTAFSTFAPDWEELEAELPVEELTEGDFWFSSAKALRTVSVLIATLQAEKQWSKGLRKSQVGYLLLDLLELERVLKVAKQKRAQFYLLRY
jgi:hypothetical protein